MGGSLFGWGVTLSRQLAGGGMRTGKLVTFELINYAPRCDEEFSKNQDIHAPEWDCIVFVVSLL